MCGIFGLWLNEKQSFPDRDLQSLVTELILLSQDRGRDAMGVAFNSGEKSDLFKRPGNAKSFLERPELSALLREGLASGSPELTIIGQCRLVTNGAEFSNENNQPLVGSQGIMIHNGIVTNAVDASGFQEGMEAANDSTELLSWLEKELADSGDTQVSLSNTFARVEGSASIALILKQQKKLVLATNTGSIYFLFSRDQRSLIFASEKIFLKKLLLRKRHLLQHFSTSGITQLEAGHALLLDNQDRSQKLFPLPEYPAATPLPVSPTLETKIFSPVKFRPELKRCVQCILPETYPLITFDEKGVCNFCRRYERQQPLGEKALEEFLDKFRSKDGSPDCLVGLSGGRDSCYGLHILKKKYGMNPIAYTFDWGLTTDTSRRNQAKICGKLGIEHIIRSPDIKQKRENIRFNVEAFLRRPHLGMVPLFMAGDKAFYEYGRTLRKEYNLPLTVFCAGHSLEQRDFMTGFCGVDENIANNKRLYKFSSFNKLKLATFYGLQYLLNPAYINRSFWDSIRSFFYSFVHTDDFLYLFEYLPWNEKEIEDLLSREYQWEADRTYGKNQWRMGDGQTAFTNYIYYKVAGFSEFDNFRSNQIREGMITRQEALALAEADNAPKMETLKYFAELVGIDLQEVLKKIDAIPKLYHD
jgi:hypothetical protein